MEKGHSRTRTNKLTAIPKVDKRRPEDSFQDLFRSYEMDAIGSKYRKRLYEIGKVFARFRGLPETLAIRNVSIENRGKLVSVVGLVSNVRAPHLVIIQA